MSKYVIGGAKTQAAPQRQMYRGSVIVEGVTKLEKTIAAMRREQAGLMDQIDRQQEWLSNPANRDDPRYEQREQIHRDRWAQWRDLEDRANDLLIQQQQRIDSLEGRERELAISRLLQWSEAPFAVALMIVAVMA